MAQIFPRYFNVVHFVLGAVGAIGAASAAGFIWYYGSPEYTDVGYQPQQPVPFSHALHAGEMGMDCRYCHNNVERSHEANVPQTSTCMNCHTEVLPNSEKLKPVRDSFLTGEPLKWERVHKVPDYAYFDHSVHLRAGVGCASCHGRIDTMEVVTQKEPLSMGWCLDCHRDPEPHLRDLDQFAVTDMRWSPELQDKPAAEIIVEKNLQPPQDCSACHR